MSAMEEWQRRLKAEKEAERQKKSESADMLRGYRGGDVEEAKRQKAAKEEARRKKEEAQKALQEYKGSDMEEVRKLKALKEEGLKQKLDAQSILHEYKAKEIDELKIKKREHRSNQQQTDALTPVNREDTSHDDEDDFPTISVSERAAWLASMASKGDTSTIAPSSEHKDDNLLTNNGSESTAAPTEAINREAITQPSAEKEPEDAEKTVVSENVEPHRTQDEVLPSAPPENSINHAPTEPEGPVETPVDNNSDLNEAITDVAADEKAPIVNHSESEKPSSSDANIATPVVEGDDEMKSEFDSSVTTKDKTKAIEKPKVTRLDVLFSFGLVTVQTDPSLEPYMNAVEEVVVKAINNDSNLASKVSYDSGFKPFVKSTVWDSQFKSKSGRADVKRMVVTASVPVFLKSENKKQSVSQTREGVVEALTAAIHTGSFLAIARGKK